MLFLFHYLYYVGYRYITSTSTACLSCCKKWNHVECVHDSRSLTGCPRPVFAIQQHSVHSHSSTTVVSGSSFSGPRRRKAFYARLLYKGIPNFLCSRLGLPLVIPGVLGSIAIIASVTVQKSIGKKNIHSLSGVPPRGRLGERKKWARNK